jgi:hypothetical protein
VKKCPECGNPSYDGAPVCGNCGFKFPKSKVAAPKEEIIFKTEPKVKKAPSSDSTIEIIKHRKLLIGAIVLITLIVILGIVLAGSGNDSSPIQVSDSNEFSQGDFSFKYPANWQNASGKDTDHSGAKFFMDDNNTQIEYYNISTEATSLKQINQQRIDRAQENGSYVEKVETVTLDGRNASNIILENADGDYTRYVSMFSDGKLYVFKIDGESINSVTTQDIDSMINSADIA